MVTRQDWKEVFTHESLARRLDDYSPHYDVKFDLPFFLTNEIDFITQIDRFLFRSRSSI